MTTNALQIQAVLFDWAGTTIDYGSRAPTQVFIEIFRSRGIEVTSTEVRGPMGRAKHDHIAALLAMPRIAQRWIAAVGHAPTQADVQSMYEEFLPLQKRVLLQGSEVIPGIVDAVAALRAHGIRIGSTTGYTRELMAVVAPAAAAQGYAPEAIICSDDVAAGRPAPDMNLLAAKRLGVSPMSSVIVVDDTTVGIEAGIRAGAITVAVTETGNALGLSIAEIRDLSPGELTTLLADAEEEFRSSGARYIVRSAAELPGLIATIEREAAPAHRSTVTSTP